MRLWFGRAVHHPRVRHGVVTGTLGVGAERDDDWELLTTAGVRRVCIRGLRSLGEQVGTVHGVAWVAVNLGGVSRDVVACGDAVVSRGAWLGREVFDVRLHGVWDTIKR